MSVNDKTENRGTHGVSSSMLDTLVSSSENPLSLDMGSVKNIKVRLTFTDGILGTSPANKDISRDFIGSKAPVPAAKS